MPLQENKQAVGRPVQHHADKDAPAEVGRERPELSNLELQDRNDARLQGVQRDFFGCLPALELRGAQTEQRGKPGQLELERFSQKAELLASHLTKAYRKKQTLEDRACYAEETSGGLEALAGAKSLPHRTQPPVRSPFEVAIS